MKQKYSITLLFAVLAIFILSGCAKEPDITKTVPQKTTVTAEETETFTVTTKETTEKTVEKTTEEAPLPEKVLLDVPYISQLPNFPTGCESVSTVMAMRFSGDEITVDEFVDNYLECGSTPHTESDGKKYGADPYEQFVGSPRSSGAYGCFSPVIKKALIKYYGTDKYIVDLKGSDMDVLCEYVAKGVPVITWATMSMAKTYTTDASQWITPSGDLHIWKKKEHCLLLVGYDNDYYYFNDPLKSKDYKYKKSTVEARYESMGKEALAIVK